MVVEHQEGLLVADFQKAYMALYGKSMPICAERNSWEFIAQSMESSHGYGLLPDLLTLKGRYSYLHLLTEPRLPYILSAAFPKGEQLSHSAKVFLQELKNFI